MFYAELVEMNSKMTDPMNYSCSFNARRRFGDVLVRVYDVLRLCITHISNQYQPTQHRGDKVRQNKGD